MQADLLGETLLLAFENTTPGDTEMSHTVAFDCFIYLLHI